MGRDPDRVESEYGEAIRLHPDHVWLHGRMVCFLLTTGREQDARATWARALSRFAPTGVSDDSRLYSELHRQVARLALHFGRLDWAQEVLADVPPRIAAESDWHDPLVQFLETLREAEVDELVFPKHVPVEDRWSGPHTLRDPADLVKVLEWYPGRIAAIDDRVHIRTARRDPAAGRVTFGWMELTPATLRSRSPDAKHLSLPAGTFVEIISFSSGGGSEQRIFSHPRVSPLEPVLRPAIFPRPDRYVRRGLAGSEP